MRRHHLRNRALLDLVEGEANGHTPVIKPAGLSKNVAQRSDSTVRVAVLDQQPRLFGHIVRNGIVNFLGCVDRGGDRLFGIDAILCFAHCTPPSMLGARPSSMSLKSIPCGG